MRQNWTDDEWVRNLKNPWNCIFVENTLVDIFQPISNQSYSGILSKLELFKPENPFEIRTVWTLKPFRNQNCLNLRILSKSELFESLRNQNFVILFELFKSQNLRIFRNSNKQTLEPRKFIDKHKLARFLSIVLK